VERTSALASASMARHFTIRDAVPDDHTDFARFFAALGVDDPTPAFDRWVSSMMPHTFFLEEHGQKIGYAYVEVFGSSGYVRHVVVDEPARGGGVGRALMKAIALRLRARGCTEWELNVKRDNAPAIRLYERCGMQPQYSTVVLRIDWAEIESLPSSGRALAVSDVDPAEDRAIERAFALQDGKVARLRSVEGQVLVQLVDETTRAVRAFARFDPMFPGSFPFHVQAPELAADLLRAIRPHARSSDVWIQLVVENDAATADLLRAAGARLMFEILHLKGPIVSE
jgi:ribosomal protein S18 acetylase RimI-like enzyme